MPRESVNITATPACNCCGANAWQRHPYTDTISYLECMGCHYYRQQRNTADDKAEQFEAEQHKFYDEDSLILSPSFSGLNAEITQRRVSTILRYLSPGAAIIEAGPGAGDLILALTTCGYATAAVEYSAVLARRLRDLTGIPIQVGDFADQQLPEAAYDAYCSFHVIEHVIDFRKHLEVARRCVKPGGLAFIATPNARGWEQRLPFRLSPNNDSSHFQLFSPEALKRVLREAGWETVATQTPSYAIAWLRVITKILRRVHKLEEDTTGGHFARSTSRNLSTAVLLFSQVTRPFRSLQEMLAGGNELFLVAKRVR